MIAVDRHVARICTKDAFFRKLMGLAWRNANA